jgi:hypothetical protein
MGGVQPLQRRSALTGHAGCHFPDALGLLRHAFILTMLCGSGVQCGALCQTSASEQAGVVLTSRFKPSLAWWRQLPATATSCACEPAFSLWCRITSQRAYGCSWQSLASITDVEWKY